MISVCFQKRCLGTNSDKEKKHIIGRSHLGLNFSVQYQGPARYCILIQLLFHSQCLPDGRKYGCLGKACPGEVTFAIGCCIQCRWTEMCSVRLQSPIGGDCFSLSKSRSADTIVFDYSGHVQDTYYFQNLQTPSPHRILTISFGCSLGGVG